MSHAVNPYRGPRVNGTSSPPLPWQWLVPLGLAVAGVSYAAHRHASVALTMLGVLVAILLLVVGWAVGRVISGQGASRLLAIVATGSLTAAIGQGWIDHAGSPMTLWAFACLGAGVFSGACSPADPLLSPRPKDSQ